MRPPARSCITNNLELLWAVGEGGNVTGAPSGEREPPDLGVNAGSLFLSYPSFSLNACHLTPAVGVNLNHLEGLTLRFLRICFSPGVPGAAHVVAQGPPRTAVLTDAHNSLARQGQRGTPELREWRLLPEAAQPDKHRGKTGAPHPESGTLLLSHLRLVLRRAS